MATKKCPFCAEEIQEEAIVCRFCRRELKPEVKAWKYKTIVFHFRNMDEGGWLKAEGTSASQAAEFFWNQFHPHIVMADNDWVPYGWEIVEPRGPSCITIESVRNAKGQNLALAGVAAVLTMGVSLIDTAVGFYKWWMSGCTLRWRKPADEPSEEIINIWTNPQNNNEWERMEQDPTSGRWFIWRRPADFNREDPNDDRWDKIPY